MPSKRYNTEGIIHKYEKPMFFSARAATPARYASSSGCQSKPVAQAVWRHEGGPGEALESAGRGKCAAKASRCRPNGRQADPQRGGGGKLLSPARRRRAVSQVQSTLGVSERRVCRALGISRSSVRYTPQPRSDESLLTRSIVRLAGQYGRYGYRRVHALLESQGWQVSHGRVMRIWRREGLKVPAKQPKRGRLWLNDGSCMRLRPAIATTCGRGILCLSGPMTDGR